MENNDNTVQKTEAKAVLESLAILDRQTNSLVRPPLWLNIIMSLLYGFMTFSWAETRHENTWMLGLIVSTIAFLISVAFYIYSQRLLGTKVKICPKDSSEFKFQLFQALLFALFFGGARALSTSGFWWASYLGGVANCLLFSYLIHNYSTGKYMTREQRDE